MKWISFA